MLPPLTAALCVIPDLVRRTYSLVHSLTYQAYGNILAPSLNSQGEGRGANEGGSVGTEHNQSK